MIRFLCGLMLLLVLLTEDRVVPTNTQRLLLLRLWWWVLVLVLIRLRVERIDIVPVLRRQSTRSYRITMQIGHRILRCRGLVHTALIPISFHPFLVDLEGVLGGGKWRYTDHVTSV